MRHVPVADHAVGRAVLAHRRDVDAVGKLEAIDLVRREQRAGHERCSLGGITGGSVLMAARQAQVNRATANASVCARGTSESTTRYSSGVCALPPTGPTAQMVGVPTAAVKPESAQPPLNSPSTLRPTSCAQDA